MKKKFLFIFISVMLICATVVCLVACNDTDNEDKSFQNAEFVSFRKKIVTILKDNGIFVNDIDAKQKTASATDSGARFKLASATDNRNAFDEIMVKPEYSANIEEIDFALAQIFGMSLKMSLCLGDGISNYFGEKEFFDIAVKIGDSYMSVSEENNVNTVRAYSPGANSAEDTFDSIDLEFISTTNYTFTSKSFGSNSTMFASGNAQKQFILMHIDVNNGGEVIYSPNGTSVYITTKDEAVNACREVIGSEALAIDKTKFYANKTNVRYTFTQEQNQALTDKYFKDIQSTTAPDRNQGVITDTKGGITYASYYVESENNTVAEIPEGIEYINKTFVIEDSTNTINSLSIPKSLKGVVNTHDENTGAELDVPRVVSTTELRIDFNADKDGQTSPKTLKNISVANGSPLFKSGTGHLRTKDGIYVCLIDALVDDYDMNLFSEYTAYVLERYEELGYTDLCFSVTELDYDFDKDNASIDLTSPLFKKLTTLNISGTYDNSDKFRLAVGTFNDMTVNVDIAESFKFHGAPVNLDFTSKDNKHHTVTVNLNGLTCIDDVTAEGVSVTINMGMPKVIYELADSVRLPSEGNGVHCVYVPTTLTEEQAQDFSFSIHTRSGKMELEVSPNSNKGNLVMPEEAGLNVTAIQITYYDWAQEIMLNSKIKYVICEQKTTDDLILVYDGTVDEFEENVTILCYGKQYSFNVRCSDGNKKYSGTTTIPQDELCHVTLKIFDSENNPITLEVPAAKGKSFFYEWYIDLERDIPDCEYIAVSSGNNILASVRYFPEMLINNESAVAHCVSIEYANKLTGDITFTVVPFNKGYDPEKVSVTGNKFECELEINWHDSVVNLVDGSAKYDGKALNLDCNGVFTMPEDCDFRFYSEDYTMMIDVHIEYSVYLENGINGEICFGTSSVSVEVTKMGDK